jgi:hypothetical protein|tara:strand:+ start:27 stop:404 length:378 start_codon:yes stop_codon:yes gene_type:complete
MTQSRYKVRNPAVVLVPILLLIVLIPTPAQGLCINAKACGILGATLLSMITIPICLVIFILGFWQKTRKLLIFFAIIPGFMAILTAYLTVISVSRFDLFYIPLIHVLLMAVMIFIGRLNVKNIEL